MSVTPSSHVIGMFTDQAIADEAVEALHNAGFENEHISYSAPGGSGGFLEGLKSLFTGTAPGADDLIHDLTNMGLSNEQAQYYVDEYNNGNTLLSVNAPGREEQVLGILHQYGAYSAHSTGVQFNNVVNPVSQPVDTAGLNDYTASGADLQSSAPGLNVQSQSQTLDGLEYQTQDTLAPITPLHDVEDQPTRPVTSEYTTEPHHALDDVVTPEHHAENGASDQILSGYEQENSAYSPDHIEAQSAQTTATAPEYGTLEGQTTEPAAAASEYGMPEDQVVHSTTTTPEYETLEDRVAQPTILSEHETVGDQASEPMVTIAEYGTTEDHVAQPAATNAEYEAMDPEDQAVQPVTAAPEYGIAGNHVDLDPVSVVTPEDRTENQMAEPTSVATEHEIEEGAPEASVAGHTLEDQAPVLSGSATKEPTASLNGVTASDTAMTEQPEQPDAVLSTQEATEQQAVLDSTYTAEPETAVTQEQPILSNPASSDSSAVTAATTQDQPLLDSQVAAEPAIAEPALVTAQNQAVLDSTVASEPAVSEPAVATAQDQPDSTVASEPSVAEPVTSQSAQSTAPVADYARKLQALQQQLQASQQQLQEVKARLQSAKEHETQIQATREQLKAIQDELAATLAELNETHSRIDQY